MKRGPKNTVHAWEEEILGKDDPHYRSHFDYRLRKQFIDTIIDELEQNLTLFCRIYTNVSKIRKFEVRKELENQIMQLLEVNEDEMSHKLSKIQSDYNLIQYEIPEKYHPILESVKQLRTMLPIEKEVLQPYKRKSTEKEKLQWITRILSSKAKIRNYRRKIRAIQGPIEEAKLELFMINERSPREIRETIYLSKQALRDVKQSGEQKLTLLRDEASKKVLSLDKSNEYRDLTNEHAQKRRKITKLTVQLQLWLNQYDKFVGEPMKELEVLEQEMSKFPEWKSSVYDPQDELYNQLNSSVEILEAELVEEQVEAFRKHHAARVLQRGWRRVLEKKKAKKKGKKKGKRKGKK